MFKVYVTISKNFIILLNGYLNNHLTDPEFNGTLMILCFNNHKYRLSYNVKLYD